MPPRSSAQERSNRLTKRPRRSPTARPDADENFLAHLKNVEETLRAIPSQEVDALVLLGRGGPQVVTLKGGEPAYRLLVEAMSEGAATLSSDGAVFFCNRRFAELIQQPPAKLIGCMLQSLVHQSERDRLAAFLRAAQKQPAKGEFNLHGRNRRTVPVYLSLSRLRGYHGHALGLVVTDLTEQKRKQAQELKQAEANRRLLLERVLAAQEEERRRIARELHDEAGQLLTSLLVGLRSLEDSTDMRAAKARGRRLREITAQAIDEIGRLAHGLHPAVLDDYGLDVALSRYVAEYTRIQRIPVDLVLNKLDPKKLPPAVQVALYRILQEALTNVARHSGATAVRIVFAHSASALQIDVIDNGRGFDTKAVAITSTGHLGIESIRERATMLGGTAIFNSSSRGTQVRVRIPLANWKLSVGDERP